MTDAVFGNIVATAGTIAGVVLGYLLSGTQARRTRKGELRSLLEAAQWELRDAKLRAGEQEAPLPFPLPTVELIVQRGMLADLPVLLRQRLLQTRAAATLQNESVALLIRSVIDGGYSGQGAARQLTEKAETAKRFVPLFESCLAPLEDHLDRLSTGWLRRLWNRLRQRKIASATPTP